MTAKPDQSPMTLQEYFEWEVQQDGKYEYIDGQVYAMTGGTIPHSTIAVNFLAALRPHVRHRSCQGLEDFWERRYPSRASVSLARNVDANG